VKPVKPIAPDANRIALSRLRIIWAALCLSPVLLFVVLIVMMAPKAAAVPTTDPDLVKMLHYISIGAAVVLLPLGYFLRLQTYKKNWVVNAVSPQGYITGNLLLLALCEGVALFTIIVTYLAGILMPFILPAIVASMTQVINWPTGKPMEPALMELPKR